MRIESAVAALTGREGYDRGDVIAVLDSLIESGTQRHGWLTDDEYRVILRQLAEGEGG